jgi:myo-inositol-1(or 4)-monophosphatase
MSTNLDFITNLARRAGDLLRGYFSLDGFAATRKADHSVVTEADMAADRLIAAAIHAAYPADGILSEEVNASLGNALAPIWVVDPLDGTNNFSQGLHYWGVSIARLQEGWPTLAGAYFPMLGELFCAEHGQGAFLNGQPLRVRPPRHDPNNTFFTCCARTQRRYHLNLPYKMRILGSTVYDLCAVARGATILSLNVTSKIWDVAAGWLIVQEAGSVIEPWDGCAPFPLHPGHDYHTADFPTLAALSPEVLAQARPQITLRQKP